MDYYLINQKIIKLIAEKIAEEISKSNKTIDYALDYNNLAMPSVTREKYRRWLKKCVEQIIEKQIIEKQISDKIPCPKLK